MLWVVSLSYVIESVLCKYIYIHQPKILLHFVVFLHTSTMALWHCVSSAGCPGRQDVRPCTRGVAFPRQRTEWESPIHWVVESHGITIYIYLIVICIIMYNLVNLAVIDNDIIKLLCYTYISIIFRLIIKQQGSRRWRDGSSLAHPKTTAFSKEQWMYSSMNFGGWPGWPIYLRPEMPVSTPSLPRSESFRTCW